jgi:hypothetical protein
MAKISIVHTTEYIYRNPVGLLRHKLMVRPDESHDLRLHSATLKVEPEPTGIYWKHDIFDNSICFLEWPQTLRTKHLSIVSTLDLTHHPDGQPLPQYSLEPGVEVFPFSYAQSEIPDIARLTERQMPDPDRKVVSTRQTSPRLRIRSVGPTFGKTLRSPVATIISLKYSAPCS